MKRFIYILAAVFALCSCTRYYAGDLTADEKALISAAADEEQGIMRVLTVRDSADLSILRSGSSDFSAKALLSPEYKRLCSLMVATVTHPSQDGVGIAGPQVGLKRRVVAVQRFDKEGEAFEVYPNIRLIWASDSLEIGPEGCLSVPDMRGNVARSGEIVIEYADIKELSGRKSKRGIGFCSRGMSEIPTVRDTVKGFTAVIFQHEVDHLDGILYTDRIR